MNMRFNLKHNTPFLVVIADDLTGALDTGIQFSNAGAKTITITKASSQLLSHYLKCNYEVISVDASTRHKSAEEASRIVSDIVNECMAFGVKYLYKKTDSVLRGNIATELIAFMNASKTKLLPYVPAFPDLGRTLRNGTLYIDGKLLLDTELGRDPFDKVSSNKISDLFVDSGVTVEDSLPAGCLPEKGERIVIYDAESNDELDEIASSLIEENYTAFAGCAGFADALSKAFGFIPENNSDFTIKLPMLIVCGSVNEISKRQLSYEEKHGTGRIRLNEKSLSDNLYFDSQEGSKIIDNIVDGLYSKGLFIVDTTADSDTPLAKSEISGEKVSASLGELATRLVGKVPGLNLFIIGGDTLLSFIVKSECFEIEPVAEIEKGIVLSVVHDGKHEINIISKSGGFGGEDLLSRILCKYKKQEVIV